MLEGMEFCRPDFLLHSLINERGEVCGFVSGDPYEAWLEGTQEVLSNDAVSFTQKADLTIAGAGGYPKDLSLYQGCKCYEPARDVTKKGGIIIALIESPDIKEPQIFWTVSATTAAFLWKRPCGSIYHSLFCRLFSLHPGRGLYPLPCDQERKL